MIVRGSLRSVPERNLKLYEDLMTRRRMVASNLRRVGSTEPNPLARIASVQG